MPFSQTPTKMPTSIGEITIVLKDPDGTNANRAIDGDVRVLDQNNKILRIWEGDLQPYLTQAQINGLITFLDDLRTQAAAELLP